MDALESHETLSRVIGHVEDLSHQVEMGMFFFFNFHHFTFLKLLMPSGTQVLVVSF